MMMGMAKNIHGPIWLWDCANAKGGAQCDVLKRCNMENGKNKVIAHGGKKIK